MFPPNNHHELQAKLEKAVKAVLLTDYPEISFRTLEVSTTADPLNPTGWRFTFKIVAQVSPLDKKTPV